MAAEMVKPDMPSHTPGTAKGEELVQRQGREPGRDNPRVVRTARDSTSISPNARRPIAPGMPHMPPP